MLINCLWIFVFFSFACCMCTCVWYGMVQTERLRYPWWRLPDASHIRIHLESSHDHGSVGTARTTCDCINCCMRRQLLDLRQLCSNKDRRGPTVLGMPTLPWHILRTIHWHIAPVIEQALRAPWQDIDTEPSFIEEADIGPQDAQVRKASRHRCLKYLSIPIYC